MSSEIIRSVQIQFLNSWSHQVTCSGLPVRNARYMMLA